MTRGSETKDRILETSTQLFLRNGYHGTGLQELCDAAGLGRGALYHHFRSKEELLFEISISLLSPVTAAAEAVAESECEPVVMLRQIARELLAEHLVHGDAWSLAIKETRALSDSHLADVIAARDRYEAVWVRVLDAGAESGAWRKVESVEIRGILGMFNTVARWVRPEGSLSTNEIADRFIELILHGISK